MDKDELKLLEDITEVQVVVTFDNPAFKREYVMHMPFKIDENFEYTLNDHVSKALSDYIIGYQDAKIQMIKEKREEAELTAAQYSAKNGGIKIEDILNKDK